MISWMWSESGRLRAEHAAPGARWEPPVDIYETDFGLMILVALPGVPADRVSLYIDARGLFLQSERLSPAARDCVRIRRMEIPYGACERHIELPPGRYTLVERLMQDGCLRLQLKRE